MKEDIASRDCPQRRIVSYVAPTFLLSITLFGAFLQCGLQASMRTMRMFDSLTLAPLFIYATGQVRPAALSVLEYKLTVP